MAGRGRRATVSGGPGLPRRSAAGSFRREWLALAAATAAAAISAACGGGPSPPPPARPYADRGFADAGPHRLHYALTPTQDLLPEIARSYGIEPRPNLALLTATLAPRETTNGADIASAQLAATAVSLTGERSPLAVKRHDEAGGATWLATVEMRHRVPTTIEIRARATATDPEIKVRLTREFRFD
jgi:hypothetical protein